MERKTYKIVEEEKILIYEEYYDSNGNIVYIKDYLADPNFEKKTKYNSFGLIELEIESVDGIETDKLIINYDGEGDAIEQNHFINGELYEKIQTIKSKNGYKRITYQDGIEVEKMIRENYDTKNYLNKFYENDELVEIQEFKYNNSTKVGMKKVYDADNNLLGIHRQKFDNKERIIEFQELNENENLIEEILTDYEGELIIKEIHRKFSETTFEHHIFYSYDKKCNQIKREVYSPTGNLIEFHYSKYDEKNRLKEERGYTIGSFNPIYGTYFNHSDFVIIHEYKE